MLVAQYYSETPEERKKVKAIAGLLDCDYRVTGCIIALAIDNHETAAIIAKAEILPIHYSFEGILQNLF